MRLTSFTLENYGCFEAVQLRVAECDARVFTLLTLEGHPLSGAVRFLGEARGDDVRFEIQVYDRAANVVDFLMMRTVGDKLQDAAWSEMVSNVVGATGGTARDPGTRRSPAPSI